MKKLTIGIVLGILITLLVIEIYTQQELGDVQIEREVDTVTDSGKDNALDLMKESNIKLGEQVRLLETESINLKKELKELQEKVNQQQAQKSAQKSSTNDEVSYVADSFRLPSHIGKQWDKLDEFNDPEFVVEKDNWAFEAEIFLNNFMQKNPLASINTPTVFCDAEACLISAIEVNVEKNIMRTPGDEELTGLWRSLSQNTKALEYFSQEKIGSSNRKDETRTKNHKWVIFRKSDSQTAHTNHDSG
jgi:predicted HTH domain antitoxin